MSNAYSIRLAFDCGFTVGAAKTFIETRGTATVSEKGDDRFHRIVRTATFTPFPGQDALPDLRDVEILHLANGLLVLTGNEEVIDNDVGRPRMVAQTWKMTPIPFEELLRVERLFARAVKRLRDAGIDVRMQPGGSMWIEGETRDDGAPV